MVATSQQPAVGSTSIGEQELATLESIQRRVLWLSTQMIHHANHVRPNVDGLKVGGHQASSASIVSIFTALWFAHLRRGDRVAPKPHGSPAYHSIQYLLGFLDKDLLPRLREFHGLQSYPSQTKDPDNIHFSLGSMGFGATVPAFAALIDRFAQAHYGAPDGRRFVSVVGDAELDEGSIWEAVAEEQLGNLGNVLWIVDLNRQSLDRVIPGIRAGQLMDMFRANNWHVLEAKYGRKLQAAFAQPGGEVLRAAIDDMSNQQYQALIRQPGEEIRARLGRLRQGDALLGFLRQYSDEQLPELVGDLGGHDLALLVDKFAEAEAHVSSPSVLFAYTVKGWGLPFAGDPLNHSAQLSQEQMDELRERLGVPADDVWAGFSEGSAEAAMISSAADRLREDQAESRRTVVPVEAVPASIGTRFQGRMSSQEAFGRIMADLPNVPVVGERVVTCSADVAVSTNLGGWVNRVGVYHTTQQEEVPLPGPRLLRWQPDPAGQHIELGISEMNLFTLLGQLGLSAELLGEHLLPIGTVYDPFICRGLDAIVHALYSGSKFVIVATPSGLTLAPEGGAHQSTVTPGIGIEMPGLRPYEPCFAREVEWTLLEALRLCCDRENGLATYLRLSTKPVDQALIEPALSRLGEEQARQDVLAGGYRLVDWRDNPGADPSSLVHIAAAGALIPEAVEAAGRLAAEGIAANVLNLTSAGRLFDEFTRSRREGLRSGRGGSDPGHLGRLIPPDERRAPIVTLLDGSSHALSFLGAVFGQPTVPLGVDAFGQSGNMPALYHEYGLDPDHVVNAALLALDLRR